MPCARLLTFTVKLVEVIIVAFVSPQISMSVLGNPVRVMKTLTVPTVKVLTAVLANRDLLEMA